jgi:hypothetical protein
VDSLFLHRLLVNTNQNMNYLITHWQPVIALLVGLVVLALYYYLQVRSKVYILRWIAKSIFRNQNMLPSAESMFNVATSFLFMVGGIWVIVAIYYLSSG